MLSFIVKRTKMGPIKEGNHVALLERYEIEKEVTNSLGYTNDCIDFFFRIDGRIIKERCPIYYNGSSKLERFIEGFCEDDSQEEQEEQEENLNLNDLVGKEFNVVVKHNTGHDGKVWANIDEIHGVADDEYQEEDPFQF